MRPFAVAGLQLELAAGANNLDLVRAHVHQAAAVYPWVQMVVLSELCVHGPSPRNAEPMPGPTERAMQALAQQNGLWLVTGSAHERDGDRIYNTASVIDPDGRVVLRYRKMFPFRPYAVGISDGDQFAVFDVPGVGRFGLSICYDIWFPETTRTLACMGAEVLIHPTMTGTVDRDIELSIVRAMAAVNQLYIVDINGARGGGVGRSIVVGPEGDVLHQASAGTEHIALELDLDRVSRTRERGLRGLGQPLKSFRDAPLRFDVYDPASPTREALNRLGPMAMPGRAPTGESKE